MVNVNDVDALSEIVDAPKALLIVGAAAAFRLAVAVFPVPPLVEPTEPVVLVKLPATVAVTFTLSVQLVLVAIETPVSETVPEPATAVGVPPQVLVIPFGVATAVPTGNVSVKPTPVRATVLAAGLVIVNVSEVVPFTVTPGAPYALAMDGGETTAKLAEAVPPVPPSVEVTVPVVLLIVPAAVPVTLTP